MPLRDYQLRAVQQLRDAFRTHRRVLLVCPCAGGKTTIAADIIQKATARGRRVLFLAHSTELVENAAERIRSFGMECGIIKSGVPEARSLTIQVASKDTLLRRVLPPADLVFADEAHRSVSATWRRLLDRYPDAYISGLTASPYRLDGKGLGTVYQSFVVAATTRELADAGYLTLPVTYSHRTPDLSAIRTVAGDFDSDALAFAMNKRELIGDIVEHWHKHANGKPTLAFAVNIAHSRSILDAFRAAGIAADHVDGATARDERAAVFHRLSSGEITVLTNVNLITEGVDLPALQCVIVARPTKSLALHRQMIGRCMRVCTDKNGAIVLDHAGNALRLGLVSDEPVWSLDGVEKPAKPPPLKNCPQCFRVIPSYVRECPECGFIFETVPNEIAHVPGELVVLPSIDRGAEYARLVALASDRGLGLGWARHQYKQRFGVWPRGLSEGGYVCGEHEWEVKQYGYKRVERCVRCLRSRTDVAAR